MEGAAEIYTVAPGMGPTCSKGWGDSWIETMWVILFRLSCSRSLASKG